MLAPFFALRAAAQEQPWAAPDEADGVSASIRDLLSRTKKAPKPKTEAKPPVGPSAPEQPWQKIVEAIRTKGDFTPQKSVFKPARFGFRDIRGDLKGPHTSDSAAILGAMNDAELFEAKAGEFVSEEWKPGTDGNWNVDQWMIATDLYGTVQDAAHVVIVKTAEMKVVSRKEIELSASDASLAAKFKSVIEYWGGKPVVQGE